MGRDIPRHTVARELLEAVDNDRADFGRVLALLIGEAGPNIESLDDEED